MVKGHVDYLDWPGRSGSGEAMYSYTFDGTVSGETIGQFDMPVAPEGYEYIYQNITISCVDDTHLHRAVLAKVVNRFKMDISLLDGPHVLANGLGPNDWIFFMVDFIIGGIFDFPGQAIDAGDEVVVQMYNFNSSSVYFIGAVNYTIRPI